MKRLLCIIALMLALVCVLVSCGDDEPTVSVNDDGYVVVNGVKTEHKVHTEPTISVIDGYIAVNGVKTGYEVKNKNHSFGDWKLYNEDETNCEKKLYYRTCPDCSTIEWKEGKYEDHSFTTVTTPATCQAKGYDTKTCNTCGKVEVCNETPIAEHDYYETFVTDTSFHWRKCKNCASITEKAEHTLGNDGVCTSCDSAIGPTEGIIYEISEDSTYAIVVTYIGNARNVRIADDYNGVPVREIAQQVFQNATITSITIPNTITTIQKDAFNSSLQNVYINDLKAYFEIKCYSSRNESSNPLFYAENLYLNGVLVEGDLIIPEGVTQIDDFSFYGYDHITSITIPNGVTFIGEYAFYSCTCLKSVHVSDTVQTIKEDAFRNCNNLETVNLGNSVNYIGYRTFSACSQIKTVNIPDSLSYVGYDAFGSSSNLITEHNNCKYLGTKDNPYFILIGTSVENFSTYEIHEDTRIIAASAFGRCTRLSKLIVPAGVESIGECAFYGQNIKELYLPKSIKVIYTHANIYGSVQNIYYEGSRDDWAKINIASDIGGMSSAFIYYNYVPEE